MTGGSRGIGAAIAAALLDRGASVVITGLDANHLETARTRLVTDADAVVGADGPAAPRLTAVVADVRDHEQAERAVSSAVETYGALDILVNNAGVGVFSDVAEQSVEAWHATIDTNLTGVFNCCRAAIPHLRSRRGGWIINISSLAGRNPFAGGAAYCASKAGLNAFSEALMQEVRYDDIRVSCVMPGSVRTEFAGTHDGVGTEWKLSPEDVAQVVIDLLGHDPRSMPSRVELRPSKPRKR